MGVCLAACDPFPSHRPITMARFALLAIVLAAVLALSGAALGADRADLVVRKGVLERPAFAARDVTVEHVIFNVGNVAARNVRLVDQSWKSSDFTPVLGLSEAAWDSIAPGSNVTHVFVLRPLGPTSHNEPIQTYPSYVEYVPTVDGDSVTVYSNDLPPLNVYSRGELSNIKAPATAWLGFAGAAALVSLAPWALWRYYQTNFYLGLPKGSLKRKNR